jgi:hypothetical protein
VSLRARFRADTHAGQEERSADGVLLVKKPDRVRLRLMLPFGPTVFDYVSWGEHTQVTLPLQGMTGAKAPPAVALFSREDVAETFLRGPQAFPGTCVPSRERDEVAVLCHDAQGVLLRRLDIDPFNGAIREEISYEAGARRMVLRYSDYRPVDGVDMPYHVAMIYPQRNLSVDIRIERYELNPTLADTLFQPSRPWGS